MDGYSNFTRAIRELIDDILDKPPILDFGEITDSMGLITNSFPIAIPANGYLMCRSLLVNEERLKPGEIEGEPDGNANNNGTVSGISTAGIEYEQYYSALPGLIPPCINSVKPAIGRRGLLVTRRSAEC